MKQSATRTVVALALALVCSLPSLASASDDAARQKLESARELYATGNWETAKEAYEEAYAASPEDSVIRAEVTLGWANLLWEQGLYEPAYERAREALDRAKKLGIDDAFARLLLTLGHIEASRGELFEAQSTLELCAELSRDQKDDNFQALCRMNSRFVRKLRGKDPGPKAQFDRDLAILEASGQPLFVGTALAKTAELRDKAGDPIGALDFLRRAHEQFEKSGSLPAISRNRMRLAEAYQRRGQWPDAAEQLEGLVLTFRNMSNRPALITAYALEGRQAEHAGDVSKALQNYKRSIAAARKVGSPQLQANANLALCEFYGRTDSPEKGVAACNLSRKLFEQVGMPTLAARALVVQARAAHSRNDLERARNLYMKAIDELAKLRGGREHRGELAVQRVNLCQVERALGGDGALKLCRDAASTLAQLDSKTPSEHAMERTTLYNVGSEARDAGNLDEARTALDSATKRFVEANEKVEAAKSLVLLGSIYDVQKEPDKAIATWSRGLRLVAKSGDVGLSTANQLRTQLGQAQLDAKKWKEAAATIKPLITDAPRLEDWDTAAWASLGLAHATLKLGERDEAIEILERGKKMAAKATDPDLAQMIDSNLEKLRR